jgi:endonuclease-3
MPGRGRPRHDPPRHPGERGRVRITVETETLVSVLGILKEALREDPLPLVAERVRTDRDPYRPDRHVLILRTKTRFPEKRRRLLPCESTPAPWFVRRDHRPDDFPVDFTEQGADHPSREPGAVETRLPVPSSPHGGLLSLQGCGKEDGQPRRHPRFRQDGICVDIHVHRISNRFGYVSTKTPNETEEALRRKLPRPFWASYNTLLVAFGRTLCRPVSPLCSRCPVRTCCERKGVAVSR